MPFINGYIFDTFYVRYRYIPLSVFLSRYFYVSVFWGTLQLKPFNIKTVFSDNNFAYKYKISEKILVTRKKNTQVIERHHLTLRTRIKRLARKTICFSKNLDIHKSVISFFINRFFFSCPFLP